STSVPSPEARQQSRHAPHANVGLRTLNPMIPVPLSNFRSGREGQNNLRKRKVSMPLRAIMEKFGAASFGAIAAAVTGLTFPGAVQLAGALTLYEMELPCPIDGQKFRTSMVASYTSRGVRLDLKPLGTDVAPYPYPVCPDNGFVIYQSEFSDAELAAIRSIVAGDEIKAYRREDTHHAVWAPVKQRPGADHLDGP